MTWVPRVSGSGRGAIQTMTRCTVHQRHPSTPGTHGTHSTSGTPGTPGTQAIKPPMNSLI